MTKTVTDLQKETCAVNTMRWMIETFSEKNNIPFEDAFFDFTKSPIYELLFDYESGVWREGPDYLMALYEEVLLQS